RGHCHEVEDGKETTKGRRRVARGARSRADHGRRRWNAKGAVPWDRPLPYPGDRARVSRAQVSASRLFSGERGRSAAEVARVGWDALERGRKLAIPGLLNRAGATAAQLLPSGLAARVVAVLQPTERK
ncbi:MAG TPA: hypothetical protein VFH82_03460, partial [Gemmatimonadota bacterium]|nr:hypothetical protein [Gemmatimonadota bacterium]